MWHEAEDKGLGIEAMVKMWDSMNEELLLTDVYTLEYEVERNGSDQLRNLERLHRINNCKAVGYEKLLKKARGVSRAISTQQRLVARGETLQRMYDAAKHKYDLRYDHSGMPVLNRVGQEEALRREQLSRIKTTADLMDMAQRWP